MSHVHNGTERLEYLLSFLFFQQHVQDGRKESLDGFVKTFSKQLPVDGNGGIYALDCEMVREVILICSRIV